jgi:alkylation response protein AidB-like acyl-CoA dehydrogenase
MEADGIEVRPLTQITGEAEFNEVFLDEVFVPYDHLIGDENNGWAVANTTLAHERGTQFPFKEQVVHEVHLSDLYEMAATSGALDDEDVADALAHAYVQLRVLRLHNWRTLSRLGRGIEPGPESSWIKLQWTEMTQHLSSTALDVVGKASPLYLDADDNPGDGRWQRQWLWSKAASIAGGTSEIQRTIIGDRILGLPR